MKTDNKTIAAVFEQKNCNLSETAKALKISRSTLQRWIKSDSELAELINEIKDGLLDFTECQLNKLIKGYQYTEVTKERVSIVDDEGNERFEMIETKRVKKIVKPSEMLIKFALATKGKERGYTVSKQIDLTSKGQAIIRPSVLYQNPNQD